MTIAILGLYLMGGIAVGTLYFASLWWNAGLFERGGRIGALIASIAVRFLLLGGALTAASLQGAMPLLAMGAGVLVARPAVLRWARVAAP